MCVGTAATALAAPTVDASPTARVGQRMTVALNGFAPGSTVAINLAPTRHRGGNCCGIDVLRRVAISRTGGAKVSFVMPAAYRNGDDRVRFVKGSRVDVIAFGNEERAIDTLRLR